MQHKRVADYTWNNEDWDLKTINKYGTRTINTSVRKLKGQAINIILNIKNEDYTEKELIIYVAKEYKGKERNYLNKAMLIKDNKIIKIFKRK